jgi:hypothetical protein
MRLTVTNTLWLLAALAGSAPGQTQVDLRTQAKSVDFSAAPSTKPFSAGANLPATCSIGQMYFVTTAISGQNVYGCSTPNTWTLQSGGPTSPTTVENSGTIVGTRSILDLSSGPGILWSLSDTGSAISVQNLLDTSFAQTRAGEQSGVNLLCASASTGAVGVSYSCAMNPTLGAYSQGMLIHWTADANGVGGATTLNVDSLGAVPVKGMNGVTNPGAADIVSGQLYAVWYDGSVFRLLNASGMAAGPSITGGGYFFPFGFPVDNGSTSSAAVRVPKLSMFVPDIGMTVASLAYDVTAAPGCSSGSPCGIAFGFYNSAGTLIGQQAGGITATGALQIFFATPVPLTAGSVYYLAWAVDNNSVALQAAGGGSLLFAALTNTGTATSGSANNSATGSGTGLTLPAATGGITLLSGSNAIVPVAAFRM